MQTRMAVACEDGKKIYVGSVEVNVPQVNRKDAPVAVRWVEQRTWDRSTELYEFRFYDGRLFERTARSGDERPLTLQSFNPSKDLLVQHNEVFYSEFFRNGIAPIATKRLLKEARAALEGYRKKPIDGDIATDRSDHPEMLSKARSFASRYIVLDGVLWKESMGPVLSLRRVNDHYPEPGVSWFHPARLKGADYRPRLFRADRLEDARRFAIALYGGDGLVVGQAPDVLEPAAITYNDDAAAVEAAGWWVLSHLRKFRKHQLPREALGSYLTLQNTIDPNGSEFHRNDQWPFEPDEVHFRTNDTAQQALFELEPCFDGPESSQTGRISHYIRNLRVRLSLGHAPEVDPDLQALDFRL